MPQSMLKVNHMEQSKEYNTCEPNVIKQKDCFWTHCYLQKKAQFKQTKIMY